MSEDDAPWAALGLREEAAVFESASQNARVLTEGWVATSLFCPNCGAQPIPRFAANRPVADFLKPVAPSDVAPRAKRVRMEFRRDLLEPVAVLAGPAAVCAGLCLTLGRRITLRGRGLALLACGLAPPAMLAAFGWLQYAATRNDRGDGAAMALAGLLILAAVSVPIDLLVAALMLRRR